MEKWKIYGYMFDCDEFIYKNRHITGFCCEIKVNQNISEKKVNENVAIQISKTNGFTIMLNSKAKNIIIQPYKIYALALCENKEEEPIEINNDVLIKNSSYIIEGINSGAESSWLLDNS